MRAERWDVEWVADVPVDPETGEADIDAAVNKCRSFPTEAQAMAYARRLVNTGETFWGCAMVRPVRQMTRQEYVADDEAVSWCEAGRFFCLVGEPIEIVAEN